MFESPQPRASVIGYLSPTAANRLSECPLKLAFSLDNRFNSLDQGGTFATLGSVSHALFRAVGEGALAGVPPSGIRAALLKAWDNEVARHYQEMVATLPGRVVPEPARWPRYQQARVRTLCSLEKIALRRNERRRPPSQARVETESFMRSDRMQIQGQVDRVEISGKTSRIIDIKTGWRPPSEVPLTVRRQLLFYAVLYSASHGEWPSELVVESADGKQCSLEWTRHEARLWVEEALEERKRFNSAASRGTDMRSLARPSVASCGYCSFKAACVCFLEAINGDWNLYLRAVAGLACRCLGRDDLVALDLDAALPDTLAAQPIRVLSVPRCAAPPTGVMIGLADLRPTRSEQQFEFTHESRLFVWKKGESEDAEN